MKRSLCMIPLLILLSCLAFGDESKETPKSVDYELEYYKAKVRIDQLKAMLQDCREQLQSCQKISMLGKARMASQASSLTLKNYEKTKERAEAERKAQSKVEDEEKGR